MDINKADRATLKAFFKKNAVPTESNFADLIDGMLNQKDDGIAKLPGDPLSIATAGDIKGPQKLVNFYGSLSDSNPAWTLQMNPRSDQNNPATAKAGFSVSDGLGASKLFIDKSTGNIGVGTISPAARLDIANLVRLGLDEGGSGPRTLSFARDAGDDGNAGKIAYKGGWGSNALHIVGAGTAGARAIKLWDNVEVAGALQVDGGINNASGLAIAQTNANDWLRINPASQFPAIALFNSVAIGTGGLSIGDWSQLPKGNLKVTGLITTSSTASPPVKNVYGVPEATSGIRFQDNPGGGGQDAAWIQYYARTGESCTLEIGTANDPDDHIVLLPSGNVGIGTNAPLRKLQIGADVGGVGFDWGTSPNAGVFRFGDNTGWKLHFGRSRESSGGALNSGITGLLMTIQDNGYVGIGTTQPFTPLHIVTKTGADAAGYGNPMCYGQHIEFAATGMWGLANSYGILHTWDTDSLFVGMKDEGSNRKDAIIAFGDDPQDNLRFMFVPSGAGSQPIEHLKITAAGKLLSSMWDVTQLLNNRQGALPVTSGSFTTGGGTLMIFASGSGWNAAGAGTIGMAIQLDGATIGYARSFTNESGSHKVFSANSLVYRGAAAGNHTITLAALAGTSTDYNDWFNVTVLEFPF